MKVRVRFAPSPTGPLHIGGIRTALYNYLFAKKNNGKFILRIEDTDMLRSVDGAENHIRESLKWLNISIDEGPVKGGLFGPYRQSDRNSLYIKHIDALISRKKAYLAFDSEDDLKRARLAQEKKGEAFLYNWRNRKNFRNSLNMSKKDVEKELNVGTNYVVRFKSYAKGDEKTITVNDVVRGQITFDKSLESDKILLKGDRTPTYHLANVVDDCLMEISHVIRGEEWLPSLGFHCQLYDAFGWKRPVFVHLPLILKPYGKGKLSKRDGEKFGFPVFVVDWGKKSMSFERDGYLPEAIINYLALLGWNPGGDKEVFTLKDLEGLFSIDDVSPSGSKLDIERCRWFNHKHIQRKSNNTIKEKLLNELEKREIFNSPVVPQHVANLIKERVYLLSEVWDEACYFYESPENYNTKNLKRLENASTASALVSLNSYVSKNLGVNWEKAIDFVAKDQNMKKNLILSAIRLALVGRFAGVSVFEILSIIGKEESLKRINNLLSRLKE